MKALKAAEAREAAGAAAAARPETSLSAVGGGLLFPNGSLWKLGVFFWGPYMTDPIILGPY